MDRRIDVAQVEFVGRDLPVGMHVPLAEQAACSCSLAKSGSSLAKGIM